MTVMKMFMFGTVEVRLMTYTDLDVRANQKPLNIPYRYVVLEKTTLIEYICTFMYLGTSVPIA